MRLRCGHVFSLKDIDDMRDRFTSDGTPPQCPCCFRYYGWKPRTGKKIISRIDNMLDRSAIGHPKSPSRGVKIWKRKDGPCVEMRPLSPPPWDAKSGPSRPFGNSRSAMPQSWTRGRRLVDVTSYYDDGYGNDGGDDWTKGLADDMLGTTSLQPSVRELPWLLVTVISESNDITPPEPPISFDDVAPSHRCAWMTALGFTRAIADGATNLPSYYIKARDCWASAVHPARVYIRELARRRRVEALVSKAVEEVSPYPVWRLIARFLPGTEDLPTVPTPLDVLTRATWSHAQERIDHIRTTLAELNLCLPFVEETMLYVDTVTRHHMGMCSKTWARALQGHARLPPAVDLCFIVDTSIQMADHMQASKDAMLTIVERMKEHHGTVDLRVGVVSFRDYPPLYKLEEGVNNRSVGTAGYVSIVGEERQLLEAVSMGWEDEGGSETYAVDLNGGLKVSPDKFLQIINSIEVEHTHSGESVHSREKALALALLAAHAEHPTMDSLKLLERNEEEEEKPKAASRRKSSRKTEEKIPAIQALAKKRLLSDFSAEWRAEISAMLPNQKWEAMSWVERWKFCYEELLAHVEFKNGGKVLWRKFAAKLVVVFSGNSPHGIEPAPHLSPSRSNSIGGHSHHSHLSRASGAATPHSEGHDDATFASTTIMTPLRNYSTGDPLGADPLHSAHIFQKMGITCWTVVCPPAIDITYSVPFLVALADKTSAKCVPLQSTDMFSTLIAASVVEHNDVANVYREAHVELQGMIELGASGLGYMRDHARAVNNARMVHQKLARRGLLSVRRAKFTGTIETTYASDIFSLAPNLAFVNTALLEMEAEASVRTQSSRVLEVARNDKKGWKKLTWRERQKLCENAVQILALKDSISVTVARDQAEHTGGPMDQAKVEEVEAFEMERRRLAREERRQSILGHSNTLFAVMRVQSSIRLFLTKLRYAIQKRKAKRFHHEAYHVVLQDPSITIEDGYVTENEVVQMLYRASRPKRYRSMSTRKAKAKPKMPGDDEHDLELLSRVSREGHSPAGESL